MPDSIHLKIHTICIKSRERKMIKDFFARFYTPFSFIIWFIVGMGVNNCQNVPTMIILISLFAAIFNAYHTFTEWKADIELITNDRYPSIDVKFSWAIFFADFMIHLICIVLSFWWIDDLHTCLNMEKYIQFYIWISLYITAIILHVMQYNITQQRRDLITKQSYNHVSSSSDTV